MHHVHVRAGLAAHCCAYGALGVVVPPMLIGVWWNYAVVPLQLPPPQATKRKTWFKTCQSGLAAAAPCRASSLLVLTPHDRRNIGCVREGAETRLVARAICGICDTLFRHNHFKKSVATKAAGNASNQTRFMFSHKKVRPSCNPAPVSAQHPWTRKGRVPQCLSTQ